MTSVREIMTPAARYIRENETLEAAARKMRDLDVGQLPICSGDDRLTGVLTDRDIVVRCLAEGGDPRTTTAGVLAKGTPVTIDADANIEDAITSMADNRVRRLPVLDGHRLVGIVSLSDITQHTTDERVGQLLRLISRS